MSLSAAERDTTIAMNDEDATAEIWTAQRRTITKLKKNPAAKLLEEGVHNGSAWARFELPKEFVSFRSTKRRRAPSK
ncbi:MAG: hypothetical protein ACXVRK_04320 [Gaiellaceae bacterium]